jgi:hypothetical protein
VGHRSVNARAANVRVVVVASGPVGLETRRRFERNVEQDCVYRPS